MGARAVRRHQIDAVVLIAAQLVVEAEVGHQLTVRRDLGLPVGAIAVGELGQPAVGHVQAEHLGVQGVALPVLAAVGGEQDGLAVRRPAEFSAVLISPEGELARRAAVGPHHEHLGEAGLQIPLRVLAVVQPGDHLQGIGPGRALRLGQRRSEGLALIGHQHGEGDQLAVRRPGDVVRGLGQVGDLGRLARRHPAHIELGPVAFGGGDIGQALAVGRPARMGMRARSRGQRRLAPRRRVHQPDRAARLVGHRVEA